MARAGNGRYTHEDDSAGTVRTVSGDQSVGGKRDDSNQLGDNVAEP